MLRHTAAAHPTAEAGIDTDALCVVLRALAPGGPVSVGDLAAWNHLPQAVLEHVLATLEATGLPLTTPVAGSRQLPWPLELLDAARIRAALGALALGGMEIHGVLDSTSAELQRRAGPADLTFVLAELQSAGRGRRGRRWLSPPGLNVELSCTKRFVRGFAGQAGLPLAIGVCVLRALESLGVTGVGLKWPNDVLARSGTAAGGKLAGILVELAGDPRGPCTAIIGVGLNVRLVAAQRDRVDQPIADLAGLKGGAAPSRNLVAARLIEALADGLRAFERDGFAAFVADYARRDLLAGAPLRLEDARGVTFGTGAGVDARGALRVRLDDGSVRVVDSAEVTVRRS